MKTNIKAAVLATGLIASVSALSPLSAYAVGETQDTSSIKITVAPTITLDISNAADGLTAEANKVAQGSITAKVTSNALYQIALKATQPNLTTASASDVIPAIENGGTSTLPTGTSAWGIKKPTDSAGVYTGLTTTSVPFFTSTANGNETPTVFEVGIMVAPSLPAGTYSTTVTVTASTL